HRHVRVEWIERSAPTPPVDGRFVVVPRGRVGGERLERLARALLQPLALGFYPALELHRLAQVEAVQERPAVEGNGSGRIAALERILESLDVARNDVGIQAQLGPAEEQLRSVQIAT